MKKKIIYYRIIVGGGKRFVKKYTKKVNRKIAVLKKLIKKQPTKAAATKKKILRYRKKITFYRGVYRKPATKKVLRRVTKKVIRRRVQFKKVTKRPRGLRPGKVYRRVITKRCLKSQTTVLRLKLALAKATGTKRQALLRRIVDLECQIKGRKYLKELKAKKGQDY